MKKIIQTFAIFMLTANVHAASTTDPAQYDDSFYCVASNPLSTVTIKVHSVKAPGFCAGQYVVSPGNILGMPAATFNNVYFEMNKLGDKNGNIEVAVSDGELDCFLGHGEGRALWGGNDNNCVVL